MNEPSASDYGTAPPKPTSVRLPAELRTRLDALLAAVTVAESARSPFARVSLHDVLVRALAEGLAVLEARYPAIVTGGSES